MPLTIRIDEGGQSSADLDGEKTTRVLPHVARRCPSCEQVFSGDARFCPFDGDPLAPAPDWNPKEDALLGETIAGRYEVAGVLGEGGMGTIYEVRHLALGRRFALKVLRRDVAQDQELVARFIQEARAAAAVGHPNIVAVIDFGELPPEQAPGRGRNPVPYFVMEHLTGTSLAAVLRQSGTLEPGRAARIFLQCTSGLAAAHAAGVVHRDLKPDNVFLTGAVGEDFVKLLDFGVAKIAGAGRLTRAGTVFGTPHYMSPEQAAGHEVDARADIYALGVMMYECFAGHVPFEADTYMGVLTKHLFVAAPPIDRVAPDPARLGLLAPIVMRCLSKEPRERYADMVELGSAIEVALAAFEEKSSLPPARPDSGSDGWPTSARGPREGRPSGGAFRLRDPMALEAPLPSVPPASGGMSSTRLIALLAVALGVATLALVVAWRAIRGADAPTGVDAARAGGSATAAPPSPAPSESATAPPVSEVASAAPSATSGGVGGVSSARPSAPAATAKPASGKARQGRDLVDPWAR